MPQDYVSPRRSRPAGKRRQFDETEDYGRGERKHARNGKQPRPGADGGGRNDLGRNSTSLKALRVPAASRLALGVVIYTHFPFDHEDGYKLRPAVVLSATGRDVVVVPCSSKEIDYGWCVQLADWKEAGLQRVSWVSARRRTTIDLIDVVSVAGELSSADLVTVEGFLKSTQPKPGTTVLVRVEEEGTQRSVPAVVLTVEGDDITVARLTSRETRGAVELEDWALAGLRERSFALVFKPFHVPLRRAVQTVLGCLAPGDLLAVCGADTQVRTGSVVLCRTRSAEGKSVTLPAVVLSVDGDITVVGQCRAHGATGDVRLHDWEAAGLRYECSVRLRDPLTVSLSAHVLAALGELSSRDLAAVVGTMS